jgi:flavin reductase (DIM6/NTAB) family NADH-FMN oxidoreductase RutF
MSMTTIDPQDFRRAMATFPSGVTVVTVLDERGDVAGFTASAFSSLSLEPALVLVCPALTASTYPQLLRAQRFAIHVLAAGQQDLALAFAAKGAAKAAGLDWTFSALGNPVLPGAACVIECALWREYEGGDHAIIVGAVQGIEVTERPVLLYHRGVMTDLAAAMREAA